MHGRAAVVAVGVLLGGRRACSHRPPAPSPRRRRREPAGRPLVNNARAQHGLAGADGDRRHVHGRGQLDRPPRPAAGARRTTPTSATSSRRTAARTGRRTATHRDPATRAGRWPPSAHRHRRKRQAASGRGLVDVQCRDDGDPAPPRPVTRSRTRSRRGATSWSGAAWDAIASRLPAYRGCRARHRRGRPGAHPRAPRPTVRRPGAGGPPSPASLHFASRQAALRARRGIPLADFLGGVALLPRHGVGASWTSPRGRRWSRRMTRWPPAGTLLLYVDVATEGGQRRLPRGPTAAGRRQRPRAPRPARRHPRRARAATPRPAWPRRARGFSTTPRRAWWSPRCRPAPPDEESALRRAAHALQAALRDRRVGAARRDAAR